MTNFEKWKDEILRLGRDGQDGIACLNGKPIPCVTIDDCCNCDFNKDSCDGKFLLWLYEEYTEPKPKLTKRERAFCEAFAFPHNEKIRRTICGNLTLDVHNQSYHLDNTWFKFIKAGATSWRVEDLLKLEVEE